MTRRFMLLFLLLLLAIVGMGSAGDVTLSTPQSEYVFQIGETGEVTLDVASSLATEVPGTLTVALTPKDGTVGAGRSQVRSITVGAGENTLAVALGTSDLPATFGLAVTFEYDGKAAHLSGVIVRFVEEVTEEETQAEEETKVTSVETAAPQSQEGTSSSRTGSSSATDRMVQAGQMPQDADALRAGMAEEDRSVREARDDLLARVMTDPVVLRLDHRLKIDGFQQAGQDAEPESGTFTLTYLRGEVEEARIDGVMHDDLAYACLDSAVPIQIPGLVADNLTFQEYAGQVTGEGLARGRTVMNLTHEDQFYSFSYGEGIAEIRAVLSGGKVREVSLDWQMNWVPLIGLMAGCTLLLVLAYATYRRRQDEVPPLPLPEEKSVPAPGPSPAEILARAEADYKAGERVQAYRGAARALREEISMTRGRGRELTDEETIALLAEADRTTLKIQNVLSKCSRVSFGGETPDKTDFMTIVAEVREIITNEDEDVQ
ncbi:hypothetical protein E2N92_03175 [Methanofollis formosanus]|uniref:DUF4129 domain-containing protein n=1 Tax=Methanofollis formosanus TaxID=299308 RepID=A0A8G0ZZZ7_9EURY|nr:hypothetical protein [Methanofollis formosanus]QYZ78501.1 hypothetical protein E2N92_03175 [Methanofollis formosanus]